MKIKNLCVSAILVCLAFVCSKIKIFQLPFGGAITLFSMLIISLPGYLYGKRLGILSCVCYATLKTIFGGYMLFPLQIALDYMWPYSAFCISGFLRNKKNGLLKAFILACTFRFICSSISGYIFYKEYAPSGMNVLIYTILYNGIYIYLEMILSILIIKLRICQKILNKIYQK